MQSVVAGKVKAGFNNLSDAFRNKDRSRYWAWPTWNVTTSCRTFPRSRSRVYDVDDSSVNFRGVAFPKGTPKEVIDKCAEVFPKMFADKKIVEKMKASGSPQRTLTRDQVIKMFNERQCYLEKLLADLKKK